MIRLSRVTTWLTAHTLPAQWSVTTARVTRLGWRPGQSGLAAVTWTPTQVRQPDTSNACNGSWHLPGLTAATPTRRKRRTSATTPGSARLQRVVPLTRCKLLSKHKLLLVL